MNTSRKIHGGSFWIPFLVFLVTTLFIPVWPLYKGSILIWVAPIWAAYASVFAAPEYVLFALPVAMIHFAICYTVAVLISSRIKN